MTEQEYEKLWAKLDAIENKTDQIHQGLYGVPDTDDKGMCGQFQDLKKDYYTFKARAMIVFFFLLGSGVLGVGIWELLKAL